MGETLAIIETQEAKIEYHEPDVMSDQTFLDTQEMKTTNREPNVVGVLGMSKLVCTTLVVVDSQKNQGGVTSVDDPLVKDT
jgi:hypothetical protein